MIISIRDDPAWRRPREMAVGWHQVAGQDRAGARLGDSPVIPMSAARQPLVRKFHIEFTAAIAVNFVDCFAVTDEAGVCNRSRADGMEPQRDAPAGRLHFGSHDGVARASVHKDLGSHRCETSSVPQRVQD